MNGKTKNLLERKLTGSFLGLAAVLLSFSLVFAACDSPAGMDADSGKITPIVVEPYDPSNPPEIPYDPPGIYPPDRPITQSFWDGDRKKIKVKFEVGNGGWGLWGNRGIVSTQDDKYLVKDLDYGAQDFDITLDKIHDGDKYLNIRWAGSYTPVRSDFIVKAKLALPDAPDWEKSTMEFSVGIDFNHDLLGSGWNIKTKNLYDVITYKIDNVLKDPDFGDALKRAKRD